ncbi:hypothetical protein EYS42_16845 [Aquabacterium lacunae]|uniref:Uncharacterized protein n=1 Tax=Aquabacterium lacunae TaxID=2528630 RepID=A0A4Q9GUD8_9BURK|nr:hypothetical protein [Aquabacterium lacunae]TBO27368.1 hypothetical protein EYS42_16845 [Aquabacterium lacunae]
MSMQIPGIKILAETDRGSIVQFEVVADSAQVESATSALIAYLPELGEISVLEPGGAECYRECRRISNELQIKRACHGAHGTWQKATLAESVNWLTDGMRLSAKNPRREQCIMSLPNASVS